MLTLLWNHYANTWSCWACNTKNILLSADSTFDSGQGSTVYSDSQSSQQSVIYSSLPDSVPPAIQRVYSPPLSESQALPHSLQQLGHYQQPSGVSLKLFKTVLLAQIIFKDSIYTLLSVGMNSRACFIYSSLVSTNGDLLSLCFYLI